MSADPFRTRDHVPDFDERVIEYERRSADTRMALSMTADLCYGDSEQEKLDLFFPAGGRVGLPVHMFIHGGYWRMFSKRDFSYVAETVIAAGAIAAIIDYALMPAVRMAEIVGQVRKAKRWIADNIAIYGGDPDRLTVSGHSAGAHLATFLLVLDEPSPPVKGALLLGGVYDIKPLQDSFLQPLIGLTDQEVEDCAPLHQRYRPGIGVSILHGDRETEPFREQASAFADYLDGQGCLVSLRRLENADHMSSVRDLGLPDSEAGRSLVKTIRKS